MRTSVFGPDIDRFHQQRIGDSKVFVLIRVASLGKPLAGPTDKTLALIMLLLVFDRVTEGFHRFVSVGGIGGHRFHGDVHQLALDVRLANLVVCGGVDALQQTAAVMRRMPVRI